MAQIKLEIGDVVNFLGLTATIKFVNGSKAWLFLDTDTWSNVGYIPAGCAFATITLKGIIKLI